MPFSVNERVVYPTFGVGRITALVTKSFFDAESQLYYEVKGEHSTVWVQVDESNARGLRRLTRPDELAAFRSVLRSRPVALNPDFRQRQRDMRLRLKLGTLHDVCEVVRDLSGHSWPKALSGYDAEALRKSSDALAQEWAAADSISVAEASAEVTGLLREARQAFQA